MAFYQKATKSPMELARTATIFAGNLKRGLPTAIRSRAATAIVSFKETKLVRAANQNTQRVTDLLKMLRKEAGSTRAFRYAQERNAYRKANNAMTQELLKETPIYESASKNLRNLRVVAGTTIATASAALFIPNPPYKLDVIFGALAAFGAVVTYRHLVKNKEHQKAFRDHLRQHWPALEVARAKLSQFTLPHSDSDNKKVKDAMRVLSERAKNPSLSPRAE